MIVIYNPHVDDFLATPPHFKILKRRALKKYGFFIEESLRNNFTINIYFDSTISAFVPAKYFRLLPKFARSIIHNIERRIWLKNNNIPFSQTRIIDQNEINDQMTLLAFSYKASTGLFDKRIKNFSKFKNVIFHLSHYHINTFEKSTNIQKLTNYTLSGDSDITNNNYFKNFFPNYSKPFLVLNFAVNERFKKLNTISSRSNKILATGTFHNLEKEKPYSKYKDFLQFFKSNTLHPKRKEIYNNYNHHEMFKVLISPYREYNGKLSSIIKKFSVAQKKYFSFNIVNEYNNYKFALVGEECIGFPPIGSFEAISCGSIALIDPAYLKGHNLIENVHYLASTSIEDSLLKITQIPLEKLEQISDAAQQYSLENFNQSAVFQQWLEKIKSI